MELPEIEKFADSDGIVQGNTMDLGTCGNGMGGWQYIERYGKPA